MWFMPRRCKKPTTEIAGLAQYYRSRYGDEKPNLDTSDGTQARDSTHVHDAHNRNRKPTTLALSLHIASNNIVC